MTPNVFTKLISQLQICIKNIIFAEMKFLKSILVIVEVTLIVYGFLLFSNYRIYLPDYHYFAYTPKQYIIEIDKNKQEIIKASLIYKTKADREKLTELMTSTITEGIFNYWYGTRWNFNGKTEVPGRGKIACGYFVTTVLRDAGVKLDRNRLACLASEAMIKELCESKNIKRFSNYSLSEFINKLPQPRHQFYLVGLDNHTGFLIAKDSEWYFVHSSGRFPFCVVKELAKKSIVLKKSKYRVLGCLNEDETFIYNWLHSIKG